MAFSLSSLDFDCFRHAVVIKWGKMMKGGPDMGRNVLRVLCLVLVLVLCACSVTPEPTQPPTVPTQPTPAPTSPPTEPTDPTQPTEPSRTAATAEELRTLAEDPTLAPGTDVYLTGEMTLEAPVIFTVPVDLFVETSVTCLAPICFETAAEGQIFVELAPGVDDSMLDLRFDTPNCHVSWPDAPYLLPETEAEAVNAASFNGTDLRARYGLGGTGTHRLVSAVLDPEENRGLEETLVFTLEGNTFYLRVPYLVEDKILEKATVLLTFSDGTTAMETMDLTQPQNYTLTDEAGQSRTYRLRADRLTYNLPVVYIEIEDGKEVTSRTKYLNATIRIDGENALGGFPSMTTREVLIRGRGHYSWNFDKTPYKLRFETKTSVLGMASSKNWVLLANYLDRSLLQNYVAMQMSAVLTGLPYTPSMYPVDVFVNGSYRGIYTLGEQLEGKDERVALQEGSGPEDTDYLLELGGSDTGDVLNEDYFHAGTLKFAAIKFPETELTQEQLTYLLNYVRAADNAVVTLNGYEDYIDVDSLIDWVILHELTYNLDCCFRRSCFLIKQADGKLVMGPAWDFDLAFGSFNRYEKGDWATIGAAGEYVGVTWMNYLIKDEAFMARFTARWNEIKDDVMDKAMTSIDTMAALMGPSVDMNFEVWDVLGKSHPGQPSSHKRYDTYEKMVQRLKDFLWERYEWLDKELR